MSCSTVNLTFDRNILAGKLIFGYVVYESDLYGQKKVSQYILQKNKVMALKVQGQQKID